jgi:hypothetical protein
MKQLFLSAGLLAACGVALAKIPAPVLDDAAKLKAAEAAQKTAWQAKVDAWQLCKAQDRVAAHYAKTKKAAPVAVPAQDAKAVATTPPSTPAPATAAAAAVAAAPAASAATGTSAPTGTVAAVPPPTPCADPGPFAFTPPEQKPLETSGAHSPAGTATSPPSVNKTAAEMQPAKKP